MTITTMDGSTSNGSAPEQHKKRSADRQITKDDNDDDKNEEDSAPTGAFAKADAETLNKRRILRAKRPEAAKESDTGTTSNNPFAAALIGTTSKSGGSVFGSGFGSGNKGFGSFGSGSSTGSSGGFGSLSTRNTENLSGFSATASNGSGWGNQRSSTITASVATNQFAFAKEPSKSSKSPIAKLPDNVEVSNGEEGEEVLLEVRAKCFLLITKPVDDESKSRQPDTLNNKPTTVGVPPSSETSSCVSDRNSSRPAGSTDPKQNPKDETKVEDPIDKESAGSRQVSNSTEKGGGEKKTLVDPQEDDERKGTPENSSRPTDEAKSTVSTSRTVPITRQEWRERGTGPLRILKNENHTRLVHRREAAPGGAGMMLLCNVVLVHECKLVAQTEKSLQLIAVKSNGHAESYLFRVKTSSEASELKGLLEKQIAAAKSCVA